MPCVLWNNLLCSLGKIKRNRYILYSQRSQMSLTWLNTQPVWRKWKRGLEGLVDRPEVKIEKNTTSRLFIALWRRMKFSDWLTDLNLNSWVCVIGERLCRFGSGEEIFSPNHPTPRTPQTHQIELLMLSGPQSSQHKCQIDYQSHWHSHRHGFL